MFGGFCRRPIFEPFEFCRAPHLPHDRHPTFLPRLILAQLCFPFCDPRYLLSDPVPVPLFVPANPLVLELAASTKWRTYRHSTHCWRTCIQEFDEIPLSRMMRILYVLDGLITGMAVDDKVIYGSAGWLEIKLITLYSTLELKPLDGAWRYRLSRLLDQR